MTALLLALVLGAPVGEQRDVERPPGEAPCSVGVFALEPDGRLLASRTGSGTRTPAMVFRGLTARLDERHPPLLFDVFSPGGQRYQTLAGAPRARAAVLPSGLRHLDGPVEARLAVAGSSIAWTSMYGRWRVVPRLEGHESPCGWGQTFTILP